MAKTQATVHPIRYNKHITSWILVLLLSTLLLGGFLKLNQHLFCPLPLLLFAISLYTSFQTAVPNLLRNTLRLSLV